MPSTWSMRFRLNYQAPGDNLNAWGLILNQQVFQALEDAIAKRVAFPLSGAKTLTTENGVEDEARCAFLDVTSGTGGTITAPSVEKLYVVRNAASGDVIVTSGAGQTATVKPGEIVWVVGDAANFRRVQATDMLGGRLTGLGSPINNSDAASKSYVDAAAFQNVNLPGQGPGTVGAFIKSDGSAAGWAFVGVADVTGAAPINAPDFMGGIDVDGPTKLTGILDQIGASRANVTAPGALNLDLATADFFTKSISANSAITFSNATASKASAFILELTSSSAAVLSVPASVKHPNGVNPLPGLGNGKHVLGFITLNGGTDWLMVVVARNVA